MPLTVETTVRHSVGPFRAFTATTNDQNLLLIYLGASTLSCGDILSLSLAESLAGLETFSGTVAVINLLVMFQHPVLNTQLSSVQVKSVD